MRKAEQGGAVVPIPQRYLDDAARPDAEVLVRDRLPAKLLQVASDNRLVGLVKEAYGYVTDPRVPRRYKLLAVAALLYFINPFDAIPDWIPGVGYLDDVGALAALVMAVRKIIDSAKDATNEVVSHALAEAQETWARRGVSQVCLALWASTIAACIGLIYYGVRVTVFDGVSPHAMSDPFVWACLLTGAFGFGYNLLFARRVWSRYAQVPAEIKERLAYVIVSVADWRQVFTLALPIIALLLILVLRAALTLRG
ncbi:MAG TPA: YkvA family protein [Candidatus Nitrosopolaris sp.]|nr:YkvA family protein [Candidatus Nitrosopolaris sp.]